MNLKAKLAVIFLLLLPSGLWAHGSAAPYVVILIGMALLVYVAHGVLGFFLAFLLRKVLNLSMGEILFISILWPVLTNAVYLPLIYHLQKTIEHGWLPYAIISLLALSIILFTLFLKRRLRTGF